MLSNPEMIEVARRIARENGVTVGDVLAKFSAGVKKSALTRDDFFWGDSDISPKNEGARIRPSRRRVAMKLKAARAVDKYHWEN